jgi:hypothetical protein
MGTRGMGSFRNFILRSVPTTVVHLSTIPVTLVRYSRIGSVESPITTRWRRPHQGAMESRNSTARRWQSRHSISGARDSDDSPSAWLWRQEARDDCWQNWITRCGRPQLR